MLEPEILDLFGQKVQRMRKHLSRQSLDGKSLAYEDTSAYAIDDKESSRAFLTSMEGFLVGKIQKQSLMRTSIGEAVKGKRGRRKTNAPKIEGGPLLLLDSYSWLTDPNRHGRALHQSSLQDHGNHVDSIH